MSNQTRSSWLALATFALFSTSAFAQQDVPAKTLPVPTGDVSPQLQKIIGMPLRNGWNVLPKTGEEWKPIADAGAEPTIKALPGLLERMKVKVEKSTIDGVRVFNVTPEKTAPGNENRVLIHMHGGCYVLNPREAALPEAVLIAGFGGFDGTPSSDRVKASIQPETTAGRITGRVTLKNVVTGVAPRSIAASSSERSKVTRRDWTTTATKHMEKVIWARIMVHRPRSKPMATNNSSSDNPVMTSGMTSGA